MSGDPAAEERARLILDALIQQRRGMSEAGVDEGLLEANRLGIVYWQRQLAQASGAPRQESEAAI
jgi:hypothetical protein